MSPMVRRIASVSSEAGPLSSLRSGGLPDVIGRIPFPCPGIELHTAWESPAWSQAIRGRAKAFRKQDRRVPCAGRLVQGDHRIGGSPPKL